MSAGRALLYLFTAYIMAGFMVLAIALPAAIALGLYEDSYTAALAKAGLIYAATCISTTLSIYLLDSLITGGSKKEAEK